MIYDLQFENGLHDRKRLNTGRGQKGRRNCLGAGEGNRICLFRFATQKAHEAQCKNER
jgi:hypothetical protein